MANTIIQPIPSAKKAFQTLFHSDLVVQWRNRRSMVMSLIVPIVFLISWKSLIPFIGGPGVLSICIAIGLPAIGLMGYSNTIARDREKGIFQRLRAAPIPTWVIMGSRITVQLVVMALMTLLTAVCGYFFDKIEISFVSYILLILAGVIGGMSFLALGQFIVGFVRSSEAVSAATRLIYFPLSILGAIGQIGLFGKITEEIVTWSPVGTTRFILVAAMDPRHMTFSALWALLATIGYGVVFAAIGIKWFTWSVN